ncbi:MAG: hypothetical protein OHK0046_27840 [Anaerolineae bacterium]
MADVLVDASYLVALGYVKDVYHTRAKSFGGTTQHNLLVPTVVLPEALYILRRVGGINAAIRFGESLVIAQMPLLPLLESDFVRALEIMQFYKNAELDFVDSCLTALAERMQITHICTFDRRDFSIIRPKHIDYFQLLP